MPGFRSNLRQRCQHKAAMLHRWMRDAELLFIHNFVAEKNDIRVDGPRPFWFGPFSSHGLLNREHTLEKLQRRQFGFYGRGTIQEPGSLGGDLYRLRLLKGRNLADGRQLTES